jgi:hypothetical protein
LKGAQIGRQAILNIIEFFLQCLAISASVAIGFVFIYGCCKAINRLFDGRVSCSTIRVKNFVGEQKSVDVRLSDGKTLTDQRFAGFANFGSDKGVPYDLQNWMVLESAAGRIFLKPQTVRSITEKAPAGSLPAPKQNELQTSH